MVRLNILMTNVHGFLGGFFLANMTTTIMIGTTAIINVQRQRKLWVTLSS